MKKLVPAGAVEHQQHAGGEQHGETEQAEMAVTSHVQQVSGMRIRVMPLERRSTVVAMKLIAPIRDAPQKIAMLRIQSVLAHAFAGSGDRADGAQAADRRSSRPAARRPDEEAATITTKRDERRPERHHVEAGERHVLGADLDGQEVIAEAALGTVVSTKNTMMVPCMVISDR